MATEDQPLNYRHTLGLNCVGEWTVPHSTGRTGDLSSAIGTGLGPVHPGSQLSLSHQGRIGTDALQDMASLKVSGEILQLGIAHTAESIRDRTR